jgi:hypothetical protein
VDVGRYVASKIKSSHLLSHNLIENMVSAVTLRSLCAFNTRIGLDRKYVD